MRRTFSGRLSEGPSDRTTGIRKKENTAIEMGKRMSIVSDQNRPPKQGESGSGEAIGRMIPPPSPRSIPSPHDGEVGRGSRRRQPWWVYQVAPEAIPERVSKNRRASRSRRGNEAEVCFAFSSASSPRRLLSLNTPEDDLMHSELLVDWQRRRARCRVNNKEIRILKSPRSALRLCARKSPRIAIPLVIDHSPPFSPPSSFLSKNTTFTPPSFGLLRLSRRPGTCPAEGSDDAAVCAADSGSRAERRAPCTSSAQ